MFIEQRSTCSDGKKNTVFYFLKLYCSAGVFLVAEPVEGSALAL